ncbi:protein cornichon homolog 4 isoform X2 [Canis lupus baileyi]|uniref:Cornichon family AMPA receptor auxiliary protein 4 n=2 Tax=Canis lupus familiaris TaxID=9615 RepID=A0A8P0PN35_CANLF|nr:protein cornichon homolog 4 isoform X2 [Canis lupus dingo]
MEAVVFVFSLLDCCALIFLSVYFIITLSDLECDYINARSCCSKLNKWVIPELIGHTVITVLMLVSLHWFIFLLNLPAATWNIYRLNQQMDPFFSSDVCTLCSWGCRHLKWTLPQDRGNHKTSCFPKRQAKVPDE